MPLSITDTQNVPLQVTSTRKGQPVALQNVSWVSSDANIVTVTQDGADPQKALLSAVTAGIAVVSFKGDKDLSDGVIDVIRTLDVVVGAGTVADVGEIVAGTPVEQPAGSPGTSGVTIPGV